MPRMPRYAPVWVGLHHVTRHRPHSYARLPPIPSSPLGESVNAFAVLKACADIPRNSPCSLYDTRPSIVVYVSATFDRSPLRDNNEKPPPLDRISRLVISVWIHVEIVASTFAHLFLSPRYESYYILLLLLGVLLFFKFYYVNRIYFGRMNIDFSDSSNSSNLFRAPMSLEN